MNFVMSLIDSFIRSGNVYEKDVHLKARLLVILHFMIFIYCLIHIIIYYYIEYYVAIAALSMVFMVSFIGLFLYKKIGSAPLAVNTIISSCFIAFFVFIYSSGGIFSPTLTYLLPIALVGFLFLNKRAGYFWSFFGILTILVFLILHLCKYKCSLYLPEKSLYVHYALTFFGSSLFVLLIVLMYDKINTEITLEIKEKSDALILTKEEIETQRDEIMQQKMIIETKNKSFTDSIQYALRIQEAMLPSNEILCENFPEHFILYKPQNIVSGDFYWMKQIKNFIFIIAADCTGHGVPGAFMSMLGISHLNAIISKRDVNPPNEILNELRKRIRKSLHQNGQEGQMQDGMDIALCIIDLENFSMKYAGANNSLYLFRKSSSENKYELYETKADKMPIGVHPKDNRGFTNNEISIENNDTIYIFSDGFASQFGGAKDEKFKTKRLKELLAKIQGNNMKTQKKMLEHALKEWQGDHEQVDDILMLGIQLNR